MTSAENSYSGLIASALERAGARAASGVAGLALLEAGVQRPPARAHLVIALAIRHTPRPLLEISAPAWKLEFIASLCYLVKS
jgi:hypothetical protein